MRAKVGLLTFQEGMGLCLKGWIPIIVYPRAGILGPEWKELEAKSVRIVLGSDVSP